MGRQFCRNVDQNAAEALDERLSADEQLARYAKALGHPARVKIIRMLARQRQCICGEMVAELPLAQSTVSQHLRILRQAGLIQCKIDGPRTRYCIARRALRRLRALVRGL